MGRRVFQMLSSVHSLEVTSQRKYWALGRSSSSPGHIWFAFLP
ncbi:hypothetical protein pdam_00020484 [Pocillopora damicornis]|uniref:Uncharacterized protein n=1 Tax=Pocillopora damicornis TaxID=46731 RepID=A0A3M6TPK9_POCDA|nr:hypothetical protein pdam_00020484 [Pocillopora damicornis]